jgi:hypothetical protein
VELIFIGKWFNTKNIIKQSFKAKPNGSVLVLVVLSIFILITLGMGILAIAYTARLRAANIKAQASANLAAGAAYEEAVHWLSQQPDVFTILVPPPKRKGRRGWKKKPDREITITGTVAFEGSRGDYTISFDHFSAAQPVYKIVANGYSRAAKRTIEALLVQAIGGWSMGKCEMPVGTSTTSPAPFTNRDVTDIPIHINSNDEPDDDELDIHILMDNMPTFTQPVSIAESRYKRIGAELDKYKGVIDLFENGIYFNQPNNKITNSESWETKIERFRDNTNRRFNYSSNTGRKPRTHLPNNSGFPYTVYPAVQLEFFVQGGIGKVRITNDCSVCGAPPGELDYMIDSQLDDYKQYDIYGFHYTYDRSDPRIYNIEESYVSTSARNTSSERGGQIYVDGNVIIGGAVTFDKNRKLYLADTGYPSQIKGRLTVVATGNIWIVSPVEYAGPQIKELIANTFLIKKVPAADNRNYLGLVSLNGVVKVVDPGLSVYEGEGPPSYPRVTYKPVALPRPFSGVKTYLRQLPMSTVVQAAITVGKGGWGEENITNRYMMIKYDGLILAGSITEAVRGAYVETGGGCRKYYYFDKRLLKGHVPGDLWFGGKFIPTPGGWRDYQP